MEKNNTKVYLGDGVYAYWDGLKMTITTEDGLKIENMIVFDPETLISLVKFLEDLMNRANV